MTCGLKLYNIRLDVHIFTSLKVDHTQSYFLVSFLFHIYTFRYTSYNIPAIYECPLTLRFTNAIIDKDNTLFY